MSSNEQVVIQMDEKAFLDKLPYKVTPTKTKGVYANPCPPDNFGSHETTQEDLTRYGLLFAKPNENHPPEAHDLYDRFFACNWQEKNRIVPGSEPQVGKTHIFPKDMAAKVVKTTEGSWTENVWAGAGKNTGTWTSIIGTWTIPSVSEPPQPVGTEGFWNIGSWIGIDGMFDSNDVLQTGIDQRVYTNGTSSCVAWYEWVTNPIVPGKSPSYVYQTNIPSLPVKPGDKIWASVGYVGHTAGSISIGNETNGKHFSITLAPPFNANFAGNSAEWIVEAPDGGLPKSSLPRFSPIVFSGCYACSPNDTAVLTPGTADTLNIVNAAGMSLTNVTVNGEDMTVNFI